MEISTINNLIMDPPSAEEMTGLKRPEEILVQDITIPTKTATVEIHSDQGKQRSDLATSLGDVISDVATVSSLSSKIDIQTKAMDKMQLQISDIKAGKTTQEQAQPDIAKNITEYNVRAEKINIEIKANSGTENESHTFFDGRFGSIPLDIEGLEQTVSVKKEELSTNKKVTTEQVEAFKYQALKILETEIVKSNESSPFKEINFGVESANFSSSKITNIIGSIVSSQANALPPHAQKFLE